MSLEVVYRSFEAQTNTGHVASSQQADGRLEAGRVAEEEGLPDGDENQVTLYLPRKQPVGLCGANNLICLQRTYCWG